MPLHNLGVKLKPNAVGSDGLLQIRAGQLRMTCSALSYLWERMDRTEGNPVFLGGTGQLQPDDDGVNGPRGPPTAWMAPGPKTLSGVTNRPIHIDGMHEP